MNTERTPNQKTSKPLGRQIINEADIPRGIIEAGKSKLPEAAKIVPAREDGGYKGKVLYANDRYVVQAVGVKQENAVVHRKEDLQMMGQKLEWREKNGMLNNVSIQVHYSGDKGKAYVWNQEREQQARAEAAKQKDSAMKEVPAKQQSKDAQAPAQSLRDQPISKAEAIDRIGLRLTSGIDNINKIAGIPEGHTLTALRGKAKSEAEGRMMERKEAKTAGDAAWLKKIDAEVKEREPVQVKARASKATEKVAELER